MNPGKPWGFSDNALLEENSFILHTVHFVDHAKVVPLIEFTVVHCDPELAAPMFHKS